MVSIQSILLWIIGINGIVLLCYFIARFLKIKIDVVLLYLVIIIGSCFFVKANESIILKTFYVVLLIVALVLLITRFKINAFLSFLVVSILAGLLLGMDAISVIKAAEKGIGDLLGSLIIVIVSGAMLGKLVADSGAAQRISSSMMNLFGVKYIHWALMITGFVIGIPLFYNVGFVLVIPLIFSVAYQYKLPVVYIGLPMLASLSVTHGFLPPHPSPVGLIAQFNADLGKTLLYGIIVAIPTVIIAGPVFARTVKDIQAKPLDTFVANTLPEEKLPGLFNSIFSSLSPVILIGITTLLQLWITKEDPASETLNFISNPSIIMLVSLFIATFTLGIHTNMTMTKVMAIYAEAVKDISMLLLIIGGSGALKEILVASGISKEIGIVLKGLNANPLIVGWLIAAIIRVCLGSATVAGLTAAGILAPMVINEPVNASLMVLAVGAGSLMFSHVNDSGFWLYKEYFNLSIKDTIRSWSLMETVVAIVGLLMVLLLDFTIQWASVL